MMPLHRRQAADESTTWNLSSSKDHPVNERLIDDSRTGRKRKRQSFSFLALMGLHFVLVIYVTMVHTKQEKFGKKSFAVAVSGWLVSLPFVLILGVGLGIFTSSSTDMPHQRYIPLLVVATVVGNQLPTFLGAGMATLGLIVFGLASRPVKEKLENNNPTRQAKKKPMLRGPMGTLLSAFLMVTVLLTENFLVWVVSATYKPSQSIRPEELPTPLQDNGQLVIKQFIDKVLELRRPQVVALRNIISVEWILVSGMGSSLVALELQSSVIRRNLWTWASRALLTLATARFIRTVSFLLTVLPSQHPKCYFSHFPFPPPEAWVPWIQVGLIPAANGGCNDLIISGHATVTSTLACLVMSVVEKPVFTASLWMLVAMDYIVEIYEGFHYSVDMWLGSVLVNFIWTVLAPVEKATEDGPSCWQKQFHPLNSATSTDIVKYAIPALAAYIQVIGLIPLSLGNYTIFVYIMFGIHYFFLFGIQQYLQHTCFCLLFMALGIYL